MRINELRSGIRSFHRPFFSREKGTGLFRTRRKSLYVGTNSRVLPPFRTPQQPASTERKRCRRVSFPFVTAAGTERRERPNPLRTKGCCHGTSGIIGLVREVT